MKADLKKEFKQIWDLALSYQDKRNDKGHAEVVTDYAMKLCEIEDVDENIVIPAAILHDIGWSQLSKKERIDIFYQRENKEARLKLKYKHQDEGVKLAEGILEKASYPEKYIKEILEIISQHDTRKGFLSPNEAAARDADKLWRFSEIGFEKDLRESSITPEHYYTKLKNDLRSPEYIYFDSSKVLAAAELEKRKKEYKILD